MTKRAIYFCKPSQSCHRSWSPECSTSDCRPTGKPCSVRWQSIERTQINIESNINN